MPFILWNVGEEGTPAGRVQAAEWPTRSNRPHRPAVDANPPMRFGLRESRLAPIAVIIIPPLRFENMRGIAIQRHPQATLCTVGMTGFTVDRL